MEEMKKAMSLNLNDYEPLDSRIYRVLLAEVPEDFQETIADVIGASNDIMLEAFETNPHSENVLRCAEFASIEQALNVRYGTVISAVKDIGTDEDYYKYLSMLIAISNAIFGEDHPFTVELTTYVRGDNPDVQSSLDLVLALNQLSARIMAKD